MLRRWCKTKDLRQDGCPPDVDSVMATVSCRWLGLRRPGRQPGTCGSGVNSDGGDT